VDDFNYTDPSMDPMEQEIRNLLADQLIRDRNNGLARKVRCGHDINARTEAAIKVIERLLIAQGSPPPAVELD
jgi:hypothetical protein